MKNKYKLPLRTGVLGLIIILLICTLNTFFQPTWLQINNYYTMKGFYEEPKNRIETLFLGASVGAYAFAPMELYRDYGICAYSVSTTSQPLLASYYWLEETYRLHKDTLKNVVLDVSEFRKSANDSSVHKVLDGMKLSPVKIRAAFDYADGDFEKTVSYILPFMLYHSRWQEIEELDFQKYGFDKVNGTRGFEPTLTTYRSLKKSLDGLKVLTTVLNENAKPAKFSEQPMHYFNKILEFCQEKGITLTLVKTPTDNWSSSHNRAVQAIADEAGLTFLDFNFSPLIDEIGYIHPYDSRESKHVNFFGTKKLMKYIGRYLTESCTVTDVRENEDYAYLAKQYERYDALYQKLFDLGQTQDVESFLKTALAGDNTVFISVKEEGSQKLTAKQREYFGSVGLEKLSSIEVKDSYIGVVSSDGVVYEAKAEKNTTVKYETVLGDKTKISLSSGKEEDKNFASCIIDGNEEAKNARGINFVVYNNIYGEIIGSFSFDTCALSEKNVYLYDFNTLIGAPEAEKEYADNPFYKDIIEYKKRTEKRNAEAEKEYIIANNDVFGFLDMHSENENAVIFISVKDDASTKLDEKDRAEFIERGFTEFSEIGFRDTYIAVAENNVVVYEKKADSAAELFFEKDNCSVRSAGFDSENISSVTVNGTEHSLNVRGINIVVYDKAEDKVIATAVFDTYKNPIKTSVK